MTMVLRIKHPGIDLHEVFFEFADHPTPYRPLKNTELQEEKIHTYQGHSHDRSGRSTPQLIWHTNWAKFIRLTLLINFTFKILDQSVNLSLF